MMLIIILFPVLMYWLIITVVMKSICISIGSGLIACSLALLTESVTVVDRESGLDAVKEYRLLQLIIILIIILKRT